MTKKTMRRIDAALKAKIELKVLREQVSVADLAQRFRAFDAGASQEVEAGREREIEKLHAKIGQLIVERESFSQEVPTMSIRERRAKLDRTHGVLSIPHQRQLLGLSRSGVLPDTAASQR
jgi:transposase